MKTKNGISMIILVITIALVLILASAITVTTGNSIANARITVFAQDLKKVEEAVKLYYEQNDEFPVLGENKAYSKGEILQIVPERNKSLFIEELELNNDNEDNDNLGAFYMIDLAKLDVQETSRGLQKDADSNELLSDVFVVSYPSMNIYYLEGLKAKDTIYFSLSSKISRVVKISEIKNYTENKLSTYGLKKIENVGTIQNVSVKRDTKTWTNKLNILIEADIEENEELYFSIGDSQMYKFDVYFGYNTIYFDNSFEMVNINSNETNINTGITKEEIENFNNLEQAERKMTIYKKKSGVIDGKIEIDLSNYDTDLPVRVTEAKIVSNEYSNTVTFKVEDATSGIKEVKYEYLREYDENATPKLYYDNVDTYETSYIYSRGKTAKINNDGTIEMEIPKDIEGIQLRIFDKAGNASESINENTTVPVYVGINETNPTKKSVHLNNIIKTRENINYATIQISSDDKNYTEEEKLNLINDGNNIYTSVVDCQDLVNIDEKIYIKINIYYGSNKVETRIKEISTYNTIENLGEGTRVESESAYNRPYVPIEFKYLEGKVNSGYVIKDKVNGNEFVWVPVKDISDFKRGVISDVRDITDYVEEDNEINTAIKNSVEKHGGFYIARYETRYVGEATFDNKNEGTYLKGNITPVINNTSNVWNYISNEYAKQVASSMYTENTKSTLISSYAYDTMLNWIISTNNKTSEQVTVDSSSWGNYLNATIENVTSYINENSINAVSSKDAPITKNSGDAIIINSSNSNYTRSNNIYDLAGNVYEWTTEIYNGECIGRGGRYNSIGSERPAAYRFKSLFNDASNHDVGFRVMLYWQ